MIEDARGCIDYDEAGEGRTVVLVPGSCSTGAAWRPVIAQLGSSYRCITTSLLGYGGTRERRNLLDTNIACEAEVLEAVIKRAGCPVHLVGHSFGGLAALAVALRGRVRLLSLTVAEAPAPEILKHMGEYRHYLTFRNMSEAYSNAYRAGKTTAIEQMIDFYGGAGPFASWPHRVPDYAVQPPVNLLDWASLWVRTDIGPAFDVAYRRWCCGRGQSSGRQARQRTPGPVHTECGRRHDRWAAHFMISTHAAEVAGVVAQHMARAEDGREAAAPMPAD